MNPPPPLPPAYRDQRKVDSEHLNLLAIFHYVVAGLALLGLGFVALHFGLMNALMSHPEAWKGPGPNSQMPPPQFITMFKAFYLVGAVVMVLAMVGNILSGIFIHRRKNRMFSLVIAGLNCLQIPFGTILGVFTIIVLARDSVRELYEAELSTDRLAV